MQGQANFGQVAVLGTPTPPTRLDVPTLFVEVAGQGNLWTPVYAREGLEVSLAYASDGDVSWRNQTSVVMVMPNTQPTVRVSGKLQVEDSTRGLTSYPAYQRHLGRQAAAEIVKALRQALTNPV